MLLASQTLLLTILCVLLFHPGLGHADDTDETDIPTKPREMDGDDLILFNVAAKGRVVELLANELARTEIIRALLVQYAKECVQNVTYLEKHCLNCMMDRCENRISECDIETPPLSEVISHDPIPIPGVQFLSQAPRDVQKHLKDFTSRARTDILDGIPESLRKESENIVHKEVDQSLKDLTDNIDTDKALQTISVHMQKAADNAHNIPELSTKVGTIIIANEGHALNLAELLASRLRDSRPFVDSIEHNSNRIAEQMPSIIDHVNERVEVFKDKISGVFNNVLNTFNRAMEQSDTSVINGNTMQSQMGFQPGFNSNMQQTGMQINQNMQQFPMNQQFSQQQRFVPANVQQLMMQGQFPTQLPNRPFPSQIPVPQPFVTGQAQMTNLNILRGQPSLQNTQLNGRIPNQLLNNPNQVQTLIPPPPRGPRPLQNMAPPLRQQPPTPQQFNGGTSNIIPQIMPQQNRPQFPTPQGSKSRPQPSVQSHTEHHHALSNGHPTQTTQEQGQGRLQAQNNPQHIPQGQAVRLQQGQVNGASGIAPTGQVLTQPSIETPQDQGSFSNQVPANPPNIQRNQIQSVRRINQAQRINDAVNPPSRSSKRNQAQAQQQRQQVNGATQQTMNQHNTRRNQMQRVNDGVLQNQPAINQQNAMRRNQLQPQQQTNNVAVQQQRFQQGQPGITSGGVSGRRKRHSDPDCDKLETSPEKYCKQYESHCHNCTLEKRLRFEVCGEGVEKARDEIKRLDKSVQGYLSTYEEFIVGQKLVLKVEMDDEKRLHKTNSYYDAYVTAKIGASIVRYKTKMILNSDDTRASGGQIGDEIWEKLWDRKIFKEVPRNVIENSEFSILGQTQNRKISDIQPAAHGSGHSTGSYSTVSHVWLVAGTAVSLLATLL